MEATPLVALLSPPAKSVTWTGARRSCPFDTEAAVVGGVLSVETHVRCQFSLFARGAFHLRRHLGVERARVIVHEAPVVLRLAGALVVTRDLLGIGIRARQRREERDDREDEERARQVIT